MVDETDEWEELDTFSTQESLGREAKAELNQRKKEKIEKMRDEMQDIYPDLSKLPKPETFLKDIKKKKNIKLKLMTGIRGETFTGKSYQAFSYGRLIDGIIQNDVKNKLFRDLLLSKLNFFIPFSPVYILGGEESTEECLYSFDNKDFFSVMDIKYIEVPILDTKIDPVASYKNLLTKLYSIIKYRSKSGGTLVIDPLSTPLEWMHYIMRRKIMKIPEIKPEQGILSRYWWWRNAEMDSLMLLFRKIPMNVICTYKVEEQHYEGSKKPIYKTLWWQRANAHLSSNIITNTKTESKRVFISRIDKCRLNSYVYGLKIRNMVGTKFMLNLLTAKPKKEVKKSENK